MEVDAHTRTGGYNQLAVAVGNNGVDKLVVIVKLNCNLSVALNGVELGQRSFFDKTLLGREHKELIVSVLGHLQERLNLLTLLELQQIDRRPAAGVAARLGYLVRLQRKHLAAVCKEHNKLVSI